MVTEYTCLLLQLPKHTFNPEAVTAQSGDFNWIQVQIGAGQAALYTTILRQDKNAAPGTVSVPIRDWCSNNVWFSVFHTDTRRWSYENPPLLSGKDPAVLQWLPFQALVPRGNTGPEGAESGQIPWLHGSRPLLFLQHGSLPQPLRPSSKL